MKLPVQGKTKDQVSSDIREALVDDADWRGGKTWSLVYFAGDDVSDVLRDAYSQAIYTNGLGPGAFKSLQKFESEVIAMTANLLGHPDAVGNMTSGGTESILMAVKAARDRAREERDVTAPEMVLPITLGCFPSQGVKVTSACSRRMSGESLQHHPASSPPPTYRLTKGSRIRQPRS